MAALTLVVLCLPGLVTAQSTEIGPWPTLDPQKKLSQYVLDTWSREDGLPSRQIRGFAQTPDGYLWLATAAGLTRFDGWRFTVLSSREIAAFESDDLLALATTRDGSLWIGSGNGLVRRRSGELTRFDLADGLPHPAVTSLHEDRQGRLWVGTRQGIRFLADGRLQAPPWADGLAHAEILAILDDADGQLFFATDGAGVLKWSGSVLSTLELDPAASFEAERQALDHVFDLALDADGVLWAGTAGGLLRYGERGWRPRRVKRGDVAALLADRAGTLWFDGDGLGRLVHGEVQRLETDAGLPDARVRALFEDREGSLWIASYNGGLARLQEGRFTPLGPPEGLPAERLTAILEDSTGHLWLGSFREGLHRRAPDGAMTSFGTVDGLPADTAWSLAEDPLYPGALWIGTERGVARFADGRITDLTARAEPHLRDAGAKPRPVRVVYADPAQSEVLWLGVRGDEEEVLRWARPGAADSRLELLTARDGLPRGHVRFFHRDRRGHLWIGTDHGLARLGEAGLYAYTVSDGVPATRFVAAHEDEAGTLWLATGDGLVRYAGGAFTTFTIADGLPQNHAWSVLEDDAERLWMSSDEGVFVVPKAAFADLESGRLDLLPSLVFGVADGMRTVECNGWGTPAAARTRDGRFWYPTLHGAVTVVPTPPRRPPPRAMVEQMVEDRQTLWTSGQDESLALPAGLHNLEIVYTATSLRHPARLRFRYRLVGYDESWIDAGSRRAAYYTHLPPGEYRFEVSAAHPEGAWSPAPARFDFSIAPHVWETDWFRLGAALALATLFLGGARWRSRRLVAARDELERRVAERTRELSRAREEAEAAAHTKARFLANMSHEIRTPLAGVLGMIDLLEKTELDGRQRSYLDMAGASSRTLLTLIDDILDFSKIEAGRLDLIRVACDPRQLVAEVLALFEARAAEKGLEVAAEIDDAVPAAIITDPIRLRQVLTNLVGNAVKFTAAGSVRLSLELRGSSQERQLRFAVRDTGVGIEPRILESIFDAFVQADGTAASTHGGTGLGLAICRQLVERMGGEIGVTSVPGAGSTFHFSLPLDTATEPAAVVPAKEDNAIPTRLAGRILLVEDNPVNREVGKVMLESLGLEVDLAGGGFEALAALEAEVYDLVLMDCRMPGMDGFEATRRIREEERHGGEDRLPIVALTANALPEDRRQCLEAGMDEHLAKPFTAQGLAEILGRFLESPI